MRVVTSPNLCKVCTEGLWLSLLHRVDFIDDVISGCKPSPSWPSEWLRTIDLQLIPLAQLRRFSNSSSPNLDLKESYSITWSKNGQVLDQFQDQTHLEVDDVDGPGVYSIDVVFSTDEVRFDPEGLLTTGGEFNVLGHCSEAH